MITAILCAAAVAAPADRAQRIAALGLVWGEARTFHPGLAATGVDWDGALERALRGMTPDEPMSASVKRLLDEARDPATRVLGPAVERTPAISSVRWASDGVLLVTVGPTAVPDEVRTLLPKARTLIVDLRTTNQIAAVYRANLFMALRDELSPRELQTPSRRALLHSGYRPTEVGYGDYFTHWQVSSSEPALASAHAPKRLLFVVDDRGEVPDLVVALQQQAGATVVAETTGSERWLVPSRLIDLPEGSQAVVPTAQLVLGKQPILPRADAVGTDGLELALKLAAGEPPSRPALKTQLYEIAWRPDKDPSATDYPSREQRLLALFRYATAVRHFFGYPELITADWDRAILAAIPDLEAAKSALEYQMALRRLLHHMPDGHASLYGSKALDALIFSPSQARTRLVEGRLAVAWATPDSGARAGDEVISFEGKPIAERLDWWFQIARGSSDRARHEYAAERALWGSKDSTVAVELRGEDGAVRKVTLKHGPFYGDFQPTGEPVQVKEGNIGYLDLRHVPLAEIAAAIPKLAKTRGLIVDLRGYPREGGWPLSGWLNARGARFGNYYLRAQVISGVVVDGERIEESMLRFGQTLPPSPVGTTYAGKVAVLIDENAMSQSEHTCLFLEAATAVTFIGSPTAGADGDVTAVNLPGAMNAWFTGQGVVHADGRPLQGVGIVPDIPAPVTFEGLRKGRDEPMERALELLRHGAQDK